jgi:hypothetical protein
MSYPIIEIGPREPEDIEQLGSKPKFWFRRGEERWLFKEARQNTGEHWAEKIAAEVAHLLGILAADVELATFGGKHGSATRSFVNLSLGSALIHGNELLAGLVAGYRRENRFKQSEHTLGNIIRAVSRIYPVGFEKNRDAALHQLAGYVVLDALIGNTDRHHENWGLLFTFHGEHQKVTMSVAPSFDHASSLGRELRDDKREQRLRNGTVHAYAQAGHGGIYLRQTDPHGASPLALALHARTEYPDYFAPWFDRVRELELHKVAAIVGDVPETWMSHAARRFAIELMQVNARYLLAS